MEEVVNAVNTTEAPVTESASVEESTVQESMDTSEKTEISQDDKQVDSEVSKPVEKESKAIPYDRFQEKVQEANEYKARLEAIEAERMEQERLANLRPEDREKEGQLQKAKETLRKLGFVTQEEQQAIVEQKLQEEKARSWFVSEMNRLESKYDGKDGLPPFKSTEVAEFMDEQMSKGQHITDPETAYKLMNYDAIVDAKAKSQRSSAYSEKQSGGVQQMTDSRSADLEAAAQSGDIRSFLKKYAGPKQ